MNNPRGKQNQQHGGKIGEPNARVKRSFQAAVKCEGMQKAAIGGLRCSANRYGTVEGRGEVGYGLVSSCNRRSDTHECIGLLAPAEPQCDLQAVRAIIVGAQECHRRSGTVCDSRDLISSGRRI